jgi:hypothetical protein
MSETKNVRDYVREDKYFIITEDSGKQTLYKHSANTDDDTRIFIAENALEMKNYFRTRNLGHIQLEERKEEAVDKPLTEASMFQGGPDNVTQGNSATDYRMYLAAELFGSTSFASQMPTADTHQDVPNIMFTQANEGMGELRPMGDTPPNMYEQSISRQLVNLSKNLFRAGRMDEAAKIVDAMEKPENAAATVLEAAMATDGKVPAELTEELYQTAAVLNSLNGK